MRQHLRESWYKYLLEIIVITVGVLGAFILNSWKEQQEHAKLEAEFVISLKKDLTRDKENLERIMRYMDHILELHEVLLPLLPDIYYNDKSKLDSLYIDAYDVIPTFYPISGTFISAVSSGNTSEFKNKELISILYQLYNSTYTRIVYNGELLDNLYISQYNKYSRERRIRGVREMTPEQITELTDDLDRTHRNLHFYKARCSKTLREINLILSNY